MTKLFRDINIFHFFSPSYPSVLFKIENWVKSKGYGFLTNQNLWIIYPKFNWKKMKWNQFNFENGI